jgi:hypothetical protein
MDYIVCGDLNAYLVTNLRVRFIKAFNLHRHPPQKFLTFNRRNMSRCIGNYDELQAALRNEFPSIPWEDSQNFLKLREQALYFDDVKFLFGVHGSVLANMIFMQDNTAVVDLQMEQWLLSFLWLAGYTGKYLVVGRDPQITWRGREPNILNISYVLSLIKAGLDALGAI